MKNVFTSYYILKVLTDEVKTKWGIKIFPTVPRFDCVAKNGFFELFESLKNPRGKLAGSLCFSYSDGDFVQNVDAKRTDDKCLTKGGNVTGIQIKEVTSDEIIATGDFQHPVAKLKYSDGAVIIINPEHTCIEIFIAPLHRNLKYELYQRYLLGDLDYEMEQLKSNAKTFFNY